MKTVVGGCGLKPPCQSKIPIVYNVNTIAVPPYIYYKSLYSTIASKQGHSLMRSHGSIIPLWFLSGLVSR